MNIVIDSNVLFSALIRGGITRKIILDSNSSFLFPQYIFLELERNKEELLIKSKIGKEDFDNLFKIILERITVVPTKTLELHLKKAWDLIKEHSPEDVMFVACALAFSDCILWSNDKKLKWQNKVKVLNTKEMTEIYKIN